MGTPSGKRLGRYEIVAELGHGAMGAIYKARDPKIDRFVAIKTILLRQSGVQEQREFRKRFFVEAQAAGRLLHPGIVTLFDVGEEPETNDPYIVMEYIEGPTLRDLLNQETRKLPLDDALRITMDLAEALDYAHGQGVVHRDIKPANILVTKEGQAKIGDFGIAQLDLSHLTLPGRVLGTPAYMSPEQLEGQQVDGRSDLFSLGAVLYSAVTGFSPFQGNSATTVCFKVANREPLQATALVPELPHEMDAVIARALAKDPAERYQRGREFARDLRELRKRAVVRRKETIWFAKPEARRTNGGAKNEDRSASPAPTDVLKWAPPPPRIARSLRSTFSSSRLLAGPVIALFMAAMVLSFLAWRQIRMARVVRPDVVENAPRASAVRSAPAEPATTVAQTGPEARAVAQTTSNAPVSAVPRAATKARARTFVTKATTQAGSKSNAAATQVSPINSGLANAPFADSNLEIRVENHFSDATLALWIDDKLAYEHPLRDGHKKHLVLLGGGVKETVTIPLAAGEHVLRVEVRSPSEQYDQSKTVAGEFPKSGEKILSINFEKHTKEMRVALGGE